MPHLIDQWKAEKKFAEFIDYAKVEAYRDFGGVRIEDNIWVEGSYGQSLITDFPGTGIDTKLVNMIVRAKYTIKAPFYSYVQPYLGWQITKADSPSAGVGDNVSPTQANTEFDLLDKLEKNNFIFGVTVLKRLVISTSFACFPTITSGSFVIILASIKLGMFLLKLISPT